MPRQCIHPLWSYLNPQFPNPRLNPIQSHPIQSHPIQSHPIQSYPIKSYKSLPWSPLPPQKLTISQTKMVLNFFFSRKDESMLSWKSIDEVKSSLRECVRWWWLIECGCSLWGVFSKCCVGLGGGFLRKGCFSRGDWEKRRRKREREWKKRKKNKTER